VFHTKNPTKTSFIGTHFGIIYLETQGFSVTFGSPCTGLCLWAQLLRMIWSFHGILENWQALDLEATDYVLEVI